MKGSRHLSAVQALLIAGVIMVAALGTLAAFGIEQGALEAVAGVASTLIVTVGGTTGVSAGRHLGEGLRSSPPSTPTPGA